MSRRFFFSGLFLLTAILLSGGFNAVGSAGETASQLEQMQKPGAEQGEFFEQQVRPLLLAKCIGCHGEKEQKGEVRLDGAEFLISESGAGPVLVPGKPGESRLMEVISHNADIKMPPDNRLSDLEIETLTRWVNLGAPFPQGTGSGGSMNPASPEGIAAFQKTHWAFQPIGNPTLPAVKNAAWPRTDIDRFVLAEMERQSLAPAAQADRRTLIRRMSFDLTGLPPTYEEILAYELDSSEQATEKIVDRLLASPRYGERWGRHWLDVARYSDTKGYVFTEERRYPFSYTYRDYVIDAFNRDLPFDRFVLEQLAADKLDLGENRQPLAAMGFLTLGRRFSNNIHDIIDDRIDVVSRGLQGLTVTCARCHDHKFDPIGTEDYYGLYGVFASSIEPGDLPMISPPKETDAYRQFETELNKFDKTWQDYRDSKISAFRSKIRDQTLLYLLAASRQREDEKASADSIEDLRPQLIKRWVKHLHREDSPDRGVFVAWLEFEKLAAVDFGGQQEEVIQRLKALPTGPEAARINPVVQQHFAAKVPRNMEEVVRAYAALLREADERWRKLLKEREGGETPVHLDDPGWEELRQVLYREEGPANPPGELAEKLLNRDEKNQLTKLKGQADHLRATSPAAPPRAMVLNDAPTPSEPKIFERGNPGRPGREVPRRFLRVVSFEERDQKYTQGSGRLELAQGIVSPQNPLTVRVIVNRVWMHHFGMGIVRTPSDFGSRGTPPTHPELLDYLAKTFMAEGWSLKKLHRKILLSALYQQSSRANPEGLKLDPENKWLWHMHPRRMEFEAMRDSWMAVCGKLDLTMGGRGVDIQQTLLSGRRTVYAFIDRQDLPGLFRVFDFASPDVSTPQRSETTIPQQALFGMNSPFVVELSRHLASQIHAGPSDTQGKVTLLYHQIYARDPTPEELERASMFVETPVSDSPAESLAGPWMYGYGECTPETKRVTEFHQFPHFNGDRWGGGPVLPDEKLGWVHLSAGGGHPGQGPGKMTIRRWVSPIAGEVEIRGTLKHGTDAGDGVRGRMVSLPSGEVREWHARFTGTETNVDKISVKPGTILDFVVDCVGDQNHDSFEWAPVIRVLSLAGSDINRTRVWNARNDFQGPAPAQLTAWEQLSQALLISNEFVFVD